MRSSAVDEPCGCSGARGPIASLRASSARASSARRRRGGAVGMLAEALGAAVAPSVQSAQVAPRGRKDAVKRPATSAGRRSLVRGRASSSASVQIATSPFRRAHSVGAAGLCLEPGRIDLGFVLPSRSASSGSRRATALGSPLVRQLCEQNMVECAARAASLDSSSCPSWPQSRQLLDRSRPGARAQRGSPSTIGGGLGARTRNGGSAGGRGRRRAHSRRRPGRDRECAAIRCACGSASSALWAGHAAAQIGSGLVGPVAAAHLTAEPQVAGVLRAHFAAQIRARRRGRGARSARLPAFVAAARRSPSGCCSARLGRTDPGAFRARSRPAPACAAERRSRRAVAGALDRLDQIVWGAVEDRAETIRTWRFRRSGLPVTSRQTCESESRMPRSASSATSGFVVKIPRSASRSRRRHS